MPVCHYGNEWSQYDAESLIAAVGMRLSAAVQNTNLLQQLFSHGICHQTCRVPE